MSRCRSSRRVSLLLSIAATWVFVAIAADRVSTRAMADVVLTASGRLSQFDSYETSTYNGPNSLPAPTEVVSDQYALGTPRGFFAYASPSHLCAVTVANQSGIAYPASSAELSGQIQFDDNAALRALIPAGQNYLNLLVTASVQDSTSVPNDPGIFRQADSATGLNASANSLVHSSVSGSLDVVNGPYDFSVNAAGAFSNFGMTGGATTVTLPIRISPFSSGGLVASYDFYLSASSLSLSPQVFGAVDLGLPSNYSSILTFTLPNGSTILNSSGPDFITLTDGTPVDRSGVTFSITPTPAAVPEPHSLFLLMGGSSALLSNAWRRRVATRRGFTK